MLPRVNKQDVHSFSNGSFPIYKHCLGSGSSFSMRLDKHRPCAVSDCVMIHKLLFLCLALQFAVKIVVSESVDVVPPVEVLSGAKDFQIPCNADFKFDQVYSFNWLFNGTFIHPSLNPGVTVLTDGSLNIDTVLHTHTGRHSKLNILWVKLL